MLTPSIQNSAGYAPLERRPASWTTSPSAGVWLSGGLLEFSRSFVVEERLGAGLKLAVLLKGQLEIGLADDPPMSVTGSTSMLFISRDAWNIANRFEAGMKLHYLTLYFDANLVEDLLQQDFDQNTTDRSPMRFSGATPTIIASLAHRILHQPFSGPAGRLFDSANAFGLAALALDMLGTGPSRNDASIANPAEIHRLHDLRAFLAENWRHPPSIDILARRFGFSVRRMMIGFRRIFGCSISEHVRELRLNEGWRLLVTGMSVTLVAESVGFTLPHFTTAFTKRFGITPGSIARRGAGN